LPAGAKFWLRVRGAIAYGLTSSATIALPVRAAA